MQKRLDALQENKRRDYAIACSSTAPIRPDTAAQVQSIQIDGKIARYVYFSEEVNEQIERLEKVCAEILNMIAQVEDNTLAALLTEYYINSKTWYEVADILDCDYRYILRRRHPAALQDIAQILDDYTKTHLMTHGDVL